MALTTYTSGEVLTAASLNANLVFAAANPPASASGLTLISTTTIGSAVATVTVTGAFSATFDNYKILISGGTNAGGGDIHMILGATVTGYYKGAIFRTYAGVTDAENTSNGSIFKEMGFSDLNNVQANIDIMQPFLTKPTTVQNFYVRSETGGRAGVSGGFLDDTISYTAFTISHQFGTTFTGGVIRVYGYANS